MATTNTAGKKKAALPKLGLRQYPVKRSINLAAVGKKPVNISLLIPALILLVLLLLLFAKFFVLDRLAEVEAAQNVVNDYKARLDADYREIAGFEDLNEVYAHYTYSGFTQEELARPSRVDVLDMIRKVVLPRAQLSSWTLSGDQLTLVLTGNSLQEINMLAQAIQDDELVNYCTVSTANTNDVRYAEAENETVSARILVYLNPQAE